ncbi:armadillo-type protein [Biscogniauxia marginata]|nr:armadillo-type protein [Biscogniauxia marginata]
MSAAPSTGSPTLRRTPATKTASMEENIKVGKEDSSTANELDGPPSLKKSVTALTTSSLVNQSCPKRMKFNHESSDANPMDNLLAKLSHQQSIHPQPSEAAKASEDDSLYPGILEHNSSSNSVPITPATETFGSTAPTTRPASATMNDENPNGDEVLRLKLELAHAQNKISRLEGFTQNRPVRSGLEHPPSTSPLDADFTPGIIPGPNTSRISGFQPFNPTSQQPMGREGGNAWSPYDDSRSDTSDALSATGFNRARNVWGGNKQPQSSFAQGIAPPPELSQNGPWSGRSGAQGYMDSNMPFEPTVSNNYRGDRLTPDYDMTVRPPGNRRGNRFDSRFGTPSFGNQPGYGGGYRGGYNNFGPGPYDSGSATPGGGPQGPMAGGMYSNYQPPPIGTPLSPLASEFTSPAASEGQIYLPTTEPINYRRLLDRNANFDWKYIVDKIVCNNDQQASIFLQQKLKVGTPDHKYAIVEAIVAQAYPLMVNRFGNFLVQRCFEHGTPDQVIKIAEAIRGCTLNLSMDPFGCHVVQKAFDSVPEDYKAIMVHELLRRIPETVIHRYACHVWQKLFELRWTESPPQIMRYVNDALRGMWHEVALGETGSLVVQNIFENCLEEDKRPCIEEVLSNIDIVAHGQFGNWCIQHICEHGAPADRSRAIDHVIRYAAEYSMDQYASKVVKKCLKIGGSEFLTRYLDRVCEGRVDRPRIPLIDIASDQYGNYLIQWILTNATAQHREVVAAHIRKHMVSLRGSKFGSRVGMLCTNPAVVTRPGPPGVGGGIGRMPAGPRYGGRGYHHGN